MNALAINASPHKDRGNTATILEPFLGGMVEAGVEVEVLYTKDLHINPCEGEWGCQFVTPGACIQDDDMAPLLTKLADADIWVLATPVHMDGMAAPLKNVLDRSVPLATPFFEIREGRTCHPSRDHVKPGPLVLVSTCGFWEMETFDPLVSHVQAVSRNTNKAFAGALLRPHAAVLQAMMSAGGPVDDIRAAAEEAGRQLVREGRIARDTLSTVSRPLIPWDVFVERVNYGLAQGGASPPA